uniref:SKICH domain-containing protein n=1 Tax=Eptatretus burgeri TaxID=7764 RepID=A0A8C4NC87_EPTBU
MENKHDGYPVWVERFENEAVVCFQNVPESYILDFAVECHYKVPPGVPLNSNDWIGLFPVSLKKDKFYQNTRPAPMK